MRSTVIGSLLLAGAASAHQAIYHEAMWCFNGTEAGVDNENTSDAVTPLYQMSKADWWMHHYNNCDQFPPAAGNFLELPAGGEITVEIATNKAFTSWAYDGENVSEWGDGGTYNYDDSVDCITSPNLHAQNESMAAGTSLAISYTSDLSQVTPENLVVFSVAYNTPFKLIANYSIPAGLPACPEEGCICVWGWVPNGCGTANMYMEPLRCKVTGATSTTPVATAKPPVWCESDSTECASGAKQLIYWHQAEGNNIEVDGEDLSGWPKSPAYNAKCGWANGAQNDIFEDSSKSISQSSSVLSPSTAGSSSSVVSSLVPSSSSVVITSSVFPVSSSGPSSSSESSSSSEPSSFPKPPGYSGWKHHHHGHGDQRSPAKRTKYNGFPHSH